MKILSILASPAPGGAEMLVRNLCAEFTRRGHCCHILFMSNAASVGNPPAFEQEFLAGISRTGVTYEVMDPRGFRNLIRATREFRHAVTTFGPDVLHAHLARGLVCRSLSGIKTPTIYTHHNVKANFPLPLFKLFDRSVHSYVAIGDACLQFLQRHTRRPITLIPNGVPDDFSRDEPRTSLKRDPFVLSVGGLTAKKDYSNLIAAAAKVVPRFLAEGRNVRFAIAGEGVERRRLEELIASHGIEANFELLGARPDVSELMQQADLLVNSSTREGLPITLIEAAMSCLPIVATDVGGNPEVVRHGVSGYIVPPERSDMLADAIWSLLNDEQTYVAFSVQAREESRRYALGACADQHLRLYEDAIGGCRRS